jgi:predicted TIM-barrel fold metal-dependent hydrolase
MKNILSIILFAIALPLASQLNAQSADSTEILLCRSWVVYKIQSNDGIEEQPEGEDNIINTYHPNHIMRISGQGAQEEVNWRLVNNTIIFSSNTPPYEGEPDEWGAIILKISNTELILDYSEEDLMGILYLKPKR